MQKKIGKKAPPKSGNRNEPPQQIRIIGGLWKRTPLPVLDATGLRPTPDRVRETVFNWLTHLLDGDWGNTACLDLFAGTGALGFEAASRGATRVVMVESHTPAVRQLEATKEKLKAAQVEIVRGDALAAAQAMSEGSRELPQRFNIIFLDPPFNLDWLAKILPVCARLLVDDGVLYVESEAAIDVATPPEWMAGWALIRAGKAGMVHYHLLQSKKVG